MTDNCLSCRAVNELKLLHAAAILASDDARRYVTLTVSPADVRRWRAIIVSADKHATRRAKEKP